ncbi:hypothetical protein, partial [Lysinibacillus xylanilyticus]|uniref:hypothetical protein n=1 Tax=Lysinibacillus xylanilyticus TaxID=582475 RepID=UPI0036D9C62B
MKKYKTLKSLVAGVLLSAGLLATLPLADTASAAPIHHKSISEDKKQSIKAALAKKKAAKEQA